MMTSKQKLDNFIKKSNYYLDCIYEEININNFEKTKEYQDMLQDLEILETLKEHLYVATGLVELKITSQEYATMHKVKYHNGIPIVNQPAIDKINKWFYRRKNNDK